MRKMCLQKIFELAKIDKRVFFIGSDLGFETLKEFRQEIPERFFMEGISEAHVIGMAAGLALEGKVTYVNTIATFISRRAFEQIAVDVCMHNVPVRMIGNGGGLVYAPLGSTHLALEDISLMRTLPNMTIVCPADADEMARFMSQTLDYPGPIYIRLAKGYDPIVSKEEYGFEIGKGIHYKTGCDALLVTTGITLQIAVLAAQQLKEIGIDTGILHLHTVKPLDHVQLLDLCQEVAAIVTIEENMLNGGLGSAVAECLAEANFNRVKKFKRIGIPDIFPDFYGSQAEIMQRLGISPGGVVETIRQLLR
ncbi:MAG: transketolase [Proteobacteria bacterium]|nr:transketolase [Desulfobacula sp.]MBU4130430.1 transketolase [Pseudomonadota bacterium]